VSAHPSVASVGGVPVAGGDPLARVTAVVVSYHSAHCAAAIAPSLAPLAATVVVDNGSGDDSAPAFAAELPAAKVVALPENLGFGAANNRGARLASTEFLLLINPDCTIAAADLRALVDTADRNPQAAVVAPRLAEAGGRDNFRWWGNRHGDAVRADGELCTIFLCGACLLVRRAAFEAVGGFDEGFFLYYEDDDLCARLSRAGWSLIFAPQAQAMHRNRGSTRVARQHRAEYLRAYHHARSKLRFARLYGPPGEAARLRWVMAAGAAATALLLCWWPLGKAASRARGRLAGALSRP
jgi:N-acetylglucosaminyl-diphospho-decaprenol L-rhamnosyltransferase